MNMVERKRVTVVVTNGIIMALYLALTILVSPVASGAIQISYLRKFKSFSCV